MPNPFQGRPTHCQSPVGFKGVLGHTVSQSISKYGTWATILPQARVREGSGQFSHLTTSSVNPSYDGDLFGSDFSAESGSFAAKLSDD